MNVHYPLAVHIISISASFFFLFQSPPWLLFCPQDAAHSVLTNSSSVVELSTFAQYS
jgi:hypothetical protein